MSSQGKRSATRARTPSRRSVTRGRLSATPSWRMSRDAAAPPAGRPVPSAWLVPFGGLAASDVSSGASGASDLSGVSEMPGTSGAPGAPAAAGVNVSLTRVSSVPVDEAGSGTEIDVNTVPTSMSARACPAASRTRSRTVPGAPGRPTSACSTRSPPGATERIPAPFDQTHCRRRPPSGGYQPVPYPTAGRTPRRNGLPARIAARRHAAAS